MTKKYAFLGPESTGKSTIAQTIAERIDGIYVPEMARGYLENIGLNYDYKDIEEIALMQMNEESNWEVHFPQKTLICDTELITIEIWMEYLGYEIPSWLISEINDADYSKYLLFNIDIPWVSDSFRVNEHDRSQIFKLFVDKLEYYKKDYVLINGVGEERVENVMRSLD